MTKKASRLVQARIPVPTYRRLTQAAAREGISTAAYLRRSLMQQFADAPAETVNETREPIAFNPEGVTHHGE